jgi:ABC-type transport system substrate-binding protein
MRQIGNTLVAIDDAGNLVPEAASAIDVSQDGLTYTFTLNAMKFHGGRDVTAEDWVYSLTRHLDPEVGSYFGYILAPIKGSAEYLAGTADHVEGLAALDDQTLQITLSSPNAPFLAGLAVSTFNVLPKEVVEQDPEGFKSHPIFTGAFMVDTYTPSQQLTLVRNPDYWETGLPYLDGVEITFGVDTSVAVLKIEKGELHWDLDIEAGSNVPPADQARLLSEPALQDYVFTYQPVAVGLLMLNSSHPGLDKLEVRQAIAYAIDKERLAVLAGNATAAGDIWMPGLFSYDATVQGYTHDPDKAKALLVEAGYPNGEGLPKDWYILVNSNSPWAQIGQSIQADLKAVGVNVDVKVVPGSEVSAAWLDTGVPILLDYQNNVVADPDEFASYWTCAAFTPNGYNFPQVCDSQWDEWIDAARVTSDTPERTAIYRDLGDALLESASWLPLWYGRGILMHSPKIGNFRLPGDVWPMAYSMKDWYLMP